MSTTTKVAPAATAREWIGLAVLALPTLLLSIDLSVLYLALPQLSETLKPSSTEQLWIMDSYGFMVAGFLVTMGTLGDRIGRRKLLLYGAAGFAFASILAAYSQSSEMLIASRALMGVAGATLMPSTLALISNMFQRPAQRATAISAWMSCFMGGMVVGPIAGGIMLEHFWWGSVFLLALPVMGLLFLAAPALLPEYKDPDPGKLDLPSVGLSLAAILPVVFGLKEIARHGVGGVEVASLVVGVAFAVTFVRRQKHLTSPLLDMGLFKIRQFSAALGMNMVAGVVMAGSFLLATLYLQLVLGYNPFDAGLWLIPGQVIMVVASLATPRLARRFRPMYVVVAGLLASAAGFAVITQLAAPSAGGATNALPLIIGFGICSAGIALPSALLIDLLVGSAPPEKAGSASSISETAAEFGIAMGVAVLGSLGAAIYRSNVVVPDGVPADSATVAADSIGGAVTVAQDLPASTGAALLNSAREAFTSGLTAAAWVGVVAFVLLAGVAMLTLREVPVYDAAPADADHSEADEAALAGVTTR